MAEPFESPFIEPLAARRHLPLLLAPNGAASSIELHETHISWVFLTARDAYKLKKPVCFDFLDFSTTDARRIACEDEVRLNRRLAAGVYYGVVPLTADADGCVSLNGPGRPIDWVVHMKRLPADQSMDRLLRADRLTPDHIRQLSARLTAFFQSQPPVTLTGSTYRGRFGHWVDDNLRELLRVEHDLEASQVRRIHSGQRTVLHCLPQWLDERVCDGRILEGHGDLRPEHIYFLPAPTIIDCLEFNLQLRQLDVADELSFLASECDVLDRPEIGRAVMEQYMQLSGDYPRAELVHFYSSYRACVRAKVAAIRSDQRQGEQRRKLLEQARRYLQAADVSASYLPQPPLLIVRGPSGSGKSTLAAAVGEQLALEVISTDAVRREQFGQRDPSANDHRYQPQARDRIYREVLQRAGRALDQSRAVILDGTFLDSRWLRRAARMAYRRGLQLLIVDCQVRDEEARQRIAERLRDGNSHSDATPALLDQQRRQTDPIPTDFPVCTLPPYSDLASRQSRVLRAIGDRLCQ